MPLAQRSRLRYSEDDVRDVRSRYAGEGTRDVRSRSRDSRRSASDRGPIGGRAYSAQSRDAYADSRLAWDDSLDEEGVEQEEREPETLSRFEKLKRKHAKDKADRKFARQYGGNGDAAPGEGGSRAGGVQGGNGLGASPFLPHAERGIIVRVATHPRR